MACLEARQKRSEQRVLPIFKLIFTDLLIKATMLITLSVPCIYQAWSRLLKASSYWAKCGVTLLFATSIGCETVCTPNEPQKGSQKLEDTYSVSRFILKIQETKNSKIQEQDFTFFLLTYMIYIYCGESQKWKIKILFRTFLFSIFCYKFYRKRQISMSTFHFC